MVTNPAGIALIKRWEGLRLKAYLCPAGVWTIGYGHTGDVKPDHVLKSEHMADVLLAFDLTRYEEAVERQLAGKVTENQFSALVSFTYNLGIKAFEGSKLCALCKEGKMSAASRQFERWVLAGGKKLPGLVARRASERALFLTP